MQPFSQYTAAIPYLWLHHRHVNILQCQKGLQSNPCYTANRQLWAMTWGKGVLIIWAIHHFSKQLWYEEHVKDFSFIGIRGRRQRLENVFFFIIIWALSSKKKAFEHAQKVQTRIILHMCKVSSMHLLFIETFYSIQWFCLWTAKALIRLHGCTGWSGSSLSTYTWRHFHMALLIYEQQRPWSNTTSMQHDQGLLILSAYFIVTNHSLSGQWRPWSDCADAQSDQAFIVNSCNKDLFFSWHGLFHYNQYLDTVSIST